LCLAGLPHPDGEGSIGAREMGGGGEKSEKTKIKALERRFWDVGKTEGGYQSLVGSALLNALERRRSIDSGPAPTEELLRGTGNLSWDGSRGTVWSR